MPKEFSIFNNCIQVGLGDYGKVTAHILDFEPSRLDAKELVRLANAAGELLAACQLVESKVNNDLLEFVKEGTYHVPLKLPELMAIKDAIAKAKGETR